MTPKERDEIRDVAWSLSRQSTLLRDFATDYFLDNLDAFEVLMEISDSIERQINELYAMIGD